MKQSNGGITKKSKCGIIVIISIFIMGSSGLNPKKMIHYEYDSKEYYQHLLKNKIETEKLGEGSYRVHFISKEMEIVKDYIPYPRVETIEIDGKSFVDSVMTYYVLSLSPTKHSILIQEYVYPKSYYDEVEENYKGYFYSDCKRYFKSFKSFHLQLYKVDLLDYNGNEINQYKRKLFKINEIPKEVKTLLNKKSNEDLGIFQFTMLSDSLFTYACANLGLNYNYVNPDFYSEIYFYNLKGKMIYSTIGSYKGQNLLSFVRSDTTYIIAKTVKNAGFPEPSDSVWIELVKISGNNVKSIRKDLPSHEFNFSQIYWNLGIAVTGGMYDKYTKNKQIAQIEFADEVKTTVMDIDSSVFTNGDKFLIQNELIILFYRGIFSIMTKIDANGMIKKETIWRDISLIPNTLRFSVKGDNENVYDLNTDEMKLEKHIFEN